LVFIVNLRSAELSGCRCPAQFGATCDDRDHCLLGMRRRSPSAVVPIPGSVTTWWIVFPDCATMNCRCRSGSPGTTIVSVPVQSKSTE